MPMHGSDKLPPAELVAAQRRRIVASRLHEIEGNPLTADEIAMFSMFEREGWSHEQRRAYILRHAPELAAE